MKIKGYLYKNKTSDRIIAWLLLEDGQYKLSTNDPGAPIVVRVITASPKLSGVPQRLVLSTNQVFTPLEELPNQFLAIKEDRHWSFLAGIEKFSLKKTCVLILLIVIAIIGMRASLPHLSDLATNLIPRSFESTIGRKAFSQFDSLFLKESKIPIKRQKHIIATATQFCRKLEFTNCPAIKFRSAPKLGANAFAFPGGPIVLTDQLIIALHSNNKILAVIAHELGHITERHGLRLVARAVGIYFLASTVFGADGGFVDELVLTSISIANSGYSRNFEKAADTFAAKAMISAGISPKFLLLALEDLKKECGKGCNQQHWFSTHPSYDERARNLDNYRNYIK